MRKFLIVLMVVAMASLLFVGCGGVTPDPDDPVDPGELVFVGIAVEPETMELTKSIEGGTSEPIVVTACYDVKGYEVNVLNTECLFLTSNSKVATVNVEGKVTAVGVGTADILVNYEGQNATLGVTVTYTPMEIKVDMPLFEVGKEKGFRIETVANDDKGKTALAYFTLPTKDEATIYYWEVIDSEWHPLPVGEEVAYGDTTVPLGDITFYFRATFNKTGTYPILVEIWTVTGTKPDEVKVELLCSKVITAVVIPAPPG
jgi:hypothetical protein